MTLCAAPEVTRVSSTARLFVFVEWFASAFRAQQCVGKRVNRGRNDNHLALPYFPREKEKISSPEELNETNIYIAPRARDRDLFAYESCKNPFCGRGIVDINVTVTPRYVCKR